jgi:hypothetical protein
VATTDRRILEVSSSGAVLRLVVHFGDQTGRVYQLDPSPDRRTLYAAMAATSEQPENCPSEVLAIRLSDGSATQFGMGSSVAVSPDGKRVAYFFPGDCSQPNLPGTAVVVRTLATNAEERFPLATYVSGVGAYEVLNWSPDSRYVAFDGRGGVRLLDTTDPNGGADARLVAPPQDRSVPLAVPTTAPISSLVPARAPSSTLVARRIVPAPPPVQEVRYLFSAVFQDARTIIGLADCCIGAQHLVAVEVATGAERAFLTVDAPVEAIRINRGTGTLAYVTALGNAWLFRGGARRHCFWHRQRP